MEIIDTLNNANYGFRFVYPDTKPVTIRVSGKFIDVIVLMDTGK